MTKANTYKIHVTCDNCDFYGEVQLPKGTAASHSIECPNCGCKTAHKPPVKRLPSIPFPLYPPFPKPKRIDDWWTTTPKEEVIPKPEWRYDPNALPKITCHNSPALLPDNSSIYNDLSWLIPVIS